METLGHKWEDSMPDLNLMTNHFILTPQALHEFEETQYQQLSIQHVTNCDWVLWQSGFVDSFPQVHEFNVAMSCEGCSNAVNRVLSRQQGQFPASCGEEVGKS